MHDHSLPGPCPARQWLLCLLPGFQRDIGGLPGAQGPANNEFCHVINEGDQLSVLSAPCIADLDEVGIGYGKGPDPRLVCEQVRCGPRSSDRLLRPTHPRASSCLAMSPAKIWQLIGWKVDDVLPVGRPARMDALWRRCLRAKSITRVRAMDTIPGRRCECC